MKGESGYRRNPGYPVAWQSLFDDNPKVQPDVCRQALAILMETAKSESCAFFLYILSAGSAQFHG